MNVRALFIVFLCACAPACAQSNDTACKEAQTNPPGLNLAVQTTDGRTSYLEGETIPLTLSFTSSEDDKYVVSTRTYDRSGRLDAEDFCITPERGADPLADYFASGAFEGGGLSSGPRKLNAEPYAVQIDLNEFRRLPAGEYTLRLRSRRTSGTARVKDAHGEYLPPAPVWSNAIHIEVVEASPEQQAQALAKAVTVLDSSDATDAEKRNAARELRFLGTEAATRELAHRFSTLQSPIGWEAMFGLFGSPHRDVALAELESAIKDPHHPITGDLIFALSKLEIESNSQYRLPPYKEGHRDEWMKLRDRKDAAYKAKRNELLDQVAASVAGKDRTARVQSALTLLSGKRLPPPVAQQMRAILVQDWVLLPEQAQNDILGVRWDRIGGPEFLPALRNVVAGPGNPQHIFGKPDRAAALEHIAEIDAAEGEKLIRQEALRPQGDIGINTLGKLAETTDTAITSAALARIRAKQPSPLDFELIARYGAADALGEMKSVFDQRLWDCRSQSAMLRYFLRVEPEYGRKEVAAASGWRKYTGCYRMRFSDLGDALSDPGVEKTAVAALDDPDGEVVGDAAEALGKYGSAEARKALLERLARFHEQWKDNPEALTVTEPFDSENAQRARIENALIHAITTGNSWLAGPEVLRQLREIVSPQRQPELDRMLAAWNGEPVGLSIWWDVSGNPFWTLDYFSGRGLASLQSKLAQWPANRRINLWMARSVLERHRKEVEAIQSAHNISLAVDEEQ